MKKIIYAVACVLALLSASNSYGQQVRLSEGSIPDLGKERHLNVEFSYDKMEIGSFNSEQDYMQRNISEFNRKEAGRGDKWAENWMNDKKEKHEPAFTASLSQNGFVIDDNAAYTIIFHTTFIEPGFHAGPVKRSAFLNGEAYIVSTADKTKILARLSRIEAKGKASLGSGYDTGGRISKCYDSAAKALAKFLKKKK